MLWGLMMEDWEAAASILDQVLALRFWTKCWWIEASASDQLARAIEEDEQEF